MGLDISLHLTGGRCLSSFVDCEEPLANSVVMHVTGSASRGVKKFYTVLLLRSHFYYILLASTTKGMHYFFFTFPYLLASSYTVLSAE